MAGQRRSATGGFLVDEQSTFTLDELAHACSVHVEWVVELVQEGVLEARGEHPERWEFPGPMLARARTALRLQRDLELNLAGVAVVLDLLEELEALRARLRALGEIP